MESGPLPTDPAAVKVIYNAPPASAMGGKVYFAKAPLFINEAPNQLSAELLIQTGPLRHYQTERLAPSLDVGLRRRCGDKLPPFRVPNLAHL